MNSEILKEHHVFLSITFCIYTIYLSWKYAQIDMALDVDPPYIVGLDYYYYFFVKNDV